MTDLLEELEKELITHGEVLKTVSTFMASHALRAQSALDPTRVQGMITLLRSHTIRMSELLLKFPLPPPAG